jgi:membrane associated rhomboid family serine protease
MTMPPVTLWLIVLNVATFLLQGFQPESMLQMFALWPLGHFDVEGLPGAVGFRPWQLVTSAFLHGNTMHLFLNMFALYMFGSDVERALGSSRHLVLYGAAVLSAALVQLLVVSVDAGPVPYPTVGASGGVFGLLLAFGVLFPRRTVVLLIPPIPMRAWVFVTLYALIELGNGVFGSQAGVAHFAHLGGMIGAWLVLRSWRRSGDSAPP